MPDISILELQVQSQSAINNLKNYQKQLNLTSDLTDKLKSTLKNVFNATALAVGFKESINAQEQLTIVSNQFSRLFSKNIDNANKALRELQDNFGATEITGKRLLNTFAQPLTGLSFDSSQITSLSLQLSKLTTDYAAFTGKTEEQSSLLFANALKGEFGELEKEIGKVDQTTTEWINGLAELQNKGYTAQQATAIQSILVLTDKLVYSQGAFNDRIGESSQELGQLKNNVTQIFAELGSMTDTVFGPLLAGLNQLISFNPKLTALAVGFAGLAGAVELANIPFNGVKKALEETLSFSLDESLGALEKYRCEIGDLRDEFSLLSNVSGNMTDKQIKRYDELSSIINVFDDSLFLMNENISQNAKVSTFYRQNMDKLNGSLTGFLPTLQAFKDMDINEKGFFKDFSKLRKDLFKNSKLGDIFSGLIPGMNTTKENVEKLKIAFTPLNEAFKNTMINIKKLAVSTVNWGKTITEVSATLAGSLSGSVLKSSIKNVFSGIGAFLVGSLSGLGLTLLKGFTSIFALIKVAIVTTLGILTAPISIVLGVLSIAVLTVDGIVSAFKGDGFSKGKITTAISGFVYNIGSWLTDAFGGTSNKKLAEQIAEYNSILTQGVKDIDNANKGLKNAQINWDNFINNVTPKSQIAEYEANLKAIEDDFVSLLVDSSGYIKEATKKNFDKAKEELKKTFAESEGITDSAELSEAFKKSINDNSTTWAKQLAQLRVDAEVKANNDAKNIYEDYLTNSKGKLDLLNKSLSEYSKGFLDNFSLDFNLDSEFNKLNTDKLEDYLSQIQKFSNELDYLSDVSGSKLVDERVGVLEKEKSIVKAIADLEKTDLQRRYDIQKETMNSMIELYNRGLESVKTTQEAFELSSVQSLELQSRRFDTDLNVINKEILQEGKKQNSILKDINRVDTNTYNSIKEINKNISNLKSNVDVIEIVNSF